MAIPSSLVLFFQRWQFLVDGHLQRRVWISLFYAISWSLWVHRNEIAFEGISFSDLKFKKLIFFHLAAWCTALIPRISVIATDLLQSADCIKSLSSQR